MLGTILKRTLLWSLPIAAAYLFILATYGPASKPWLALSSLLIPLFGVLAKAVEIYKENAGRPGARQTAREAEIIWCWTGIAISAVMFLISWPGFHAGALGSLAAVGALGRRLRAPTQ